MDYIAAICSFLHMTKTKKSAVRICITMMHTLKLILLLRVPRLLRVMDLDEAYSLIGNAPLFQVQENSNMPVAMNKWTGWFFKMGAGVFIYFKKIIMKIIEDYF